MLRAMYGLVYGLLLVLVIGAWSAANATYYSFTGNITSISDGSGVIAAKSNFAQGDIISFTIRTDPSQNAIYEMSWGTMELGSGSTFTRYYADYVSGNAINHVTGLEDVLWHYEAYSSHDHPIIGQFNVLSGSNRLNVWADSVISNWTAGTLFSGTQFLKNDTGSISYLEFNAQLTRIADTVPTPIPGAVWLLGSGLVALFGIRRKMKS